MPFVRSSLVVALVLAHASCALAADAAPSPLLAVDRNRATVVERIVGEWGDALATSNAGMGREQLRAMLDGLRADHLLAASLAGSLSGLRDVLSNALVSAAPVSRAVQEKALGDATQDLLYTPITPCRLFDTRPSQGGAGALVPSVTRTYGVTGAVGAQGGPGGCAAPSGAVVALVHVGTLSPAGSGLLNAGEQGTSPLASATLVYQAGDQYGTVMSIPLNAANGQFDIVARFSPTDAYGDLLGFFRPASGFVAGLTAGSGLSVTGTTTPTIGLAASYRLPQACANGEVAKSDGAGNWTCAADNNAGGTVTSVTAGTGLTGGTITGTGTIAVNTAVVQSRVTGACGGGAAVQSITSGGAVNCGSFEPSTRTLHAAGQVSVAPGAADVVLMGVGGIEIVGRCTGASQARVFVRRTSGSGIVANVIGTSASSGFAAASITTDGDEIQLGLSGGPDRGDFNVYASSAVQIDGSYFSFVASGNCQFEASALRF